MGAVKDCIKDVSKHPILSGLAVTGIMYGFYLLDSERQAINQLSAVPAGCFTYLVTSSVRDYIFFKRHRREYKDLEDKIRSTFLENPKLSAAAGSLAGIAAFTSLVPDTAACFDSYRVAVLEGLGYGGIVGELVPVSLNVLGRLRADNEKEGLVARVYNWIYENPYVIGLGVAGYEFASRFNEYPNTIAGAVANISKSLFSGLLATMGTTLLGGLLHTESIELNKAKILRKYYQLTKNKERLIELQERILELSKSRSEQVRELVTLGNLYHQQGQESKASIAYKSALRLVSKRSERLSFPGFLSESIRFKQRIPKDFDLPTLVIAALEGDTAVVGYIAGLEQEKGKPEGLYTAGKALEIIGQEQRGRYLKRLALEQIITKQGLEVLQGKTRNTVSICKNQFFRSEVIVKSGPRQKLLDEADLTCTIRRILQPYEDYDAPNPICILDIDGGSYLCMEFEPGETLYSRLQNSGSVEDIKKTIQALLIVYSRLDPSSAEVPERDYKSYMQSSFNYLEPDKLDGLVRAVSILEDTSKNIPRVLQKDAQPKNILITPEGTIVLLDNELTRQVPLTSEAADLLDYLPVLDQDQRLRLALQLKEQYEERSGTKISNADFVNSYLGFRVLRTLDRYNYFINEQELVPLLVQQLADSRLVIPELKERLNGYGQEIDYLDNVLAHLESNTKSLQA